MKRPLPALLGLGFAAGFATAAAADSDMSSALAEGAKRMTAGEIVDRLAGKTVTFENANTGSRVLVYYDEANGTVLKPVGAADSMKGFYAVDLADHVCVGVWSDKPMRVRCVNVLLIDDVMHKFELDGSLRGRIVEEVDGDVT